jgi:NADH-quinone oxidoreductase subunit L
MTTTTAHHGTTHHAPHESPWVVTVPLVLLAIPSVVIGFMTIGPMLFGDFFKDAIFVNAAAHPAMGTGQDLPRPGRRWPPTH